jgi:hypothetical protein
VLTPEGAALSVELGESGPAQLRIVREQGVPFVEADMRQVSFPVGVAYMELWLGDRLAIRTTASSGVLGARVPLPQNDGQLTTTLILTDARYATVFTTPPALFEVRAPE